MFFFLWLYCCDLFGKEKLHVDAPDTNHERKKDYLCVSRRHNYEKCFVYQNDIHFSNTLCRCCCFLPLLPHHYHHISLSPISLDNYPWKNYFLNTNSNNNNDLNLKQSIHSVLYTVKWSLCGALNAVCNLHTSECRDDALHSISCDPFVFCVWFVCELRCNRIQAHTSLGGCSFT